MDKLEYAKTLLENGLMTEDEYNTIVNMSDSQDAYTENRSGTVANFVNCFQDYLVCHGNTISTATVYVTIAKKFFVWLYNTKKEFVYSSEVKPFSSDDINKFLVEIAKEKKSLQYTSNINNALIKMAYFINDTQAFNIRLEEIYDTGLVSNTLLKKKTFNNYIPEDEIYQIADKLGGRPAAMILLSYEVCLKRDEMMSLKTKNVNKTTQTVFVEDENGEIIRYVKVSKKLLKYVQEHLNLTDEEFEKSNKRRESRGTPLIERNDLLFQSKKSSTYKVSPTYFKKTIQRSIKLAYPQCSTDEMQALVDKLTFENIRKSRILYYYIKGLSQEEIDELTGGVNQTFITTYRREADMIRENMKWQQNRIRQCL